MGSSFFEFCFVEFAIFANIYAFNKIFQNENRLISHSLFIVLNALYFLNN
jgi:hypothetical protein